MEACKPEEREDALFEPVPKSAALTNIVMYNVRDLTIAGLTNLCSNYGCVQDVHKSSSNPNVAFVKFTTESDAINAIDKLNSKLGFGYRAQFQHRKKYLPKSTEKIAPVQRLDDEDWEKVSSLFLEYNYSLLPPLSIKFPKREPLGTKGSYLSAVAGPMLRKVDPEYFFAIEKVAPAGEDAKQPEQPGNATGHRQKRLETYMNGSAGGQFQADRNEYKHSGLTDEQLASFGPVQHCVVCGGYGFVYCAKCGTHYCSTFHQKQHLAKHELVCPTGKAAGGQTSKESKHAAEDKRSNVVAPCGSVLSRDPLPNKAQVYITVVLTHDRVFVRSADPAVEREYLQTLSDCERVAIASGQPIEGAEPVCGEIYLAPGAPHGTFGRVLLVEPGPTESKCVFIEHGTVSFVTNRALLHIGDRELKYRPVHVYKVSLAGITNELGEREKAIRHLGKLKKHRLEMRHRMEAGNMVDVQLYTNHGESVNEALNRLIIIPPILSRQEHSTYIMYKDMAQTYPAQGDNKSIMILNRTTVQIDGRVSWIAMDDLGYLETLHEKLQHYGKKVSTFQCDYTPRIDELCLVRCLDRWYRAVCCKTAGDGKPALFLCDYGCMVIAHLQDIRAIPPLLASPVRTHDGVVKGLLEAKASGMKFDSDLLDAYLPENEPLAADISVVTKQEALVNIDGPEEYTVLNLPMFTDYTESFVRRLV